MKTTKILWASLCAAVSMQVYAYDFEKENIYYNILSEEPPTATVTFGDNLYTGSVVIPTTIENAGITYTVTGIGEKAFQNCVDLTDITFPENMTGLGSNAFDGCTGLTSIKIPAGVENIGSSAFKKCGNLTTVELGTGVRKIGANAFQECALLNSINLPNEMTEIGSAAFQRCTVLSGITLPDSLSLLGNNAFEGCKALTSITIPGNVETIGNNAFIYCSLLNTAIISEGVKVIGASAFCQCKVLSDLTLPSTLTQISNYAFSGCKPLTELTIPENVTTIGSNAFEYCSGVVKMEVLATTPPEITANSFKSVPTDIPVYVPQGCLELYQANEFWNVFINLQEAGDSPTTGITELTVWTDNIEISGREIILNISDDAAKAGTQVYNMNGQCIYRTNEKRFTLSQPGAYIIKNGNESAKVAVK